MPGECRLRPAIPNRVALSGNTACQLLDWKLLQRIHVDRRNRLAGRTFRRNSGREVFNLRYAKSKHRPITRPYDDSVTRRRKLCELEQAMRCLRLVCVDLDDP